MEEIDKGHVWLKIETSELSRGEVASRPVVCIENTCNGKKIYCEALNIDKYFLKRYNKCPRHRIVGQDVDRALVISKWYRRRLGGLRTQKEYNLRITNAKGLKPALCAQLQHPQLIVRISTWLALISVSLGLLSVFISFASCLKSPARVILTSCFQLFQ